MQPVSNDVPIPPIISYFERAEIHAVWFIRDGFIRDAFQRLLDFLEMLRDEV